MAKLNIDENLRNELAELFLEERNSFERSWHNHKREVENLFMTAYRNLSYLILRFPDARKEGKELFIRMQKLESDWYDAIAAESHKIWNMFLNTLPHDKLKLDQIKSEMVFLEESIRVLKLELKRITQKKKLRNDEQE